MVCFCSVMSVASAGRLQACEAELSNVAAISQMSFLNLNYLKLNTIKNVLRNSYVLRYNGSMDSCVVSCYIGEHRQEIPMITGSPAVSAPKACLGVDVGC